MCQLMCSRHASQLRGSRMECVFLTYEPSTQQTVDVHPILGYGGSGADPRTPPICIVMNCAKQSCLATPTIILTTPTMKCRHLPNIADKLGQVWYSTPDQSKSGLACHMTILTAIQLLYKLGGGIPYLGRQVGTIWYFTNLNTS